MCALAIVSDHNEKIQRRSLRFFFDCSVFDQCKSRLGRVFYHILQVLHAASHICVGQELHKNNSRLFACSRNNCAILN